MNLIRRPAIEGRVCRPERGAAEHEHASRRRGERHAIQPARIAPAVAVAARSQRRTPRTTGLAPTRAIASRVSVVPIRKSVTTRTRVAPAATACPAGAEGGRPGDERGGRDEAREEPRDGDADGGALSRSARVEAGRQERDRDDPEGARELDGRRDLDGLRPVRGGGPDDRARVVDRERREEPEPRFVETEDVPDRREDDERGRVEEEDRRERDGHRLRFRLDRRCDRRDRAAAADRRPGGHEDGRVLLDAQGARESEPRRARQRDPRGGVPDAPGPHPRDDREIRGGPEPDDGEAEKEWARRFVPAPATGSRRRARRRSRGRARRPRARTARDMRPRGRGRGRGRRAPAECRLAAMASPQRDASVSVHVVRRDGGVTTRRPGFPHRGGAARDPPSRGRRPGLALRRHDADARRRRRPRGRPPATARASSGKPATCSRSGRPRIRASPRSSRGTSAS